MKGSNDPNYGRRAFNQLAWEACLIRGLIETLNSSSHGTGKRREACGNASELWYHHHSGMSSSPITWPNPCPYCCCEPGHSQEPFESVPTSVPTCYDSSTVGHVRPQGPHSCDHGDSVPSCTRDTQLLDSTSTLSFNLRRGYENLVDLWNFLARYMTYLASHPASDANHAQFCCKASRRHDAGVCALFLPDYKARNEASIPCTPTTMNRQSFKPASLTST